MGYLKELIDPKIEERRYPGFVVAETQHPDWIDGLAHWLAHNPNVALTVATHMSNNTPLRLHGFQMDRPLSAYFSIRYSITELGEPILPELLIELGLIQGDGTAKLHDYLNQNVDYKGRFQLGYHLFSGHFAETIWGSIALLDQLYYATDLTTDHAVLINSLVSNEILPINSQGQPVLL